MFYGYYALVLTLVGAVAFYFQKYEPATICDFVWMPKIMTGLSVLVYIGMIVFMSGIIIDKGEGSFSTFVKEQV